MQRWFSISKSFLLSGFLVVGLSHLGLSEIIGKSIAKVNGDAIFLSEFENNWGSLLEQRQQMAPGVEIPAAWKKEQKKLLLDQMIEERLLLQEAERKKIRVQRRQLEEGIRQVSNRFKNIEKGKKLTKEDYERKLTKKEKSEFLKELDTQGLTEKEFEAKIEDQLKIVRLTEEEIRSRVPRPFKGGRAAKRGKPGIDPRL